MRSVFICGTDTGIGKTLVTGLIAKHLASSGINVITQKWVETGAKKISADISSHERIMGNRRKISKQISDLQNPYKFSFPSSPQLAAKLDKKKINIAKIISSYKKLLSMYDFVVVEGAGGALVPFTSNTLQIDVVKDLDIPVILVVGNRLGAINQALMTVEALHRRKIRIEGLVFNCVDPTTDKKILNDNIDTVKKITGLEVLGVIPFTGSLSKLPG